MKRFAVLVAVLMMTATMSFAGDLVGWIADEKCANAGKAASEAHAGCAQGCVKGGAPIVFVNDADKKVYKVSNPDSVKDHVGHKVTVAGKIEGSSITVDSVKM